MFPLLLAAALAPAPASAVVARVGGDPVTVGEVVARAQAAGLPPLAALETLLREVAVARAARAEGLDRLPEVRATLDGERRRIAVERLLEEEVFSRITATDAEVLAEFRARNDQVRLSLVVRPTQAEAEASLTRLRAGAALIEEGRTSSDPQVAAKSGVLGWVLRGALTAPLARAAFTAPILEPVGPVPVPKGFAVVVVHERHLGSEAQLAGERERLGRIVQIGKRDEAVARYAAQLAAGSRHARKTMRPGEEQRALEDEALARGLDRGPAAQRALAVLERDLLVRVYLARVAAGAGEAGEDEVQARWRDEPEVWTSPPRRACVHVVARDEAGLQQLLARLEGGAPLEAVAREATQLAGAHAGAVELTQAELDEMAQPGNDEALAAALAGTDAGRFTEPIHARRGWTAFRCEALRPAERVPLERARGAIADRLRQERAGRAVDQTIARLRQQAAVELDEGALAAAVGPLP